METEAAEGLPAGLLGLEDVEQQLLDVAGGQLVDVLGGHVPGTDLQLVFHSLDDPPEPKTHSSPNPHLSSFLSVL